MEIENVYGYDEIKRELDLIRSWLTDKTLVDNKKVMIPHGILFHSFSVGTGKTSFIREYSKTFDCKTFVIEGKESNIADEITNIFSEARKESFAIVLIDELDLLIDKNPIVVRILQQELDGINNSNSILVLATTNNYNNIPEALLRPGRLGVQFEISLPNKKVRKEMIEHFLKELNVDTSNIDFEYLSYITNEFNGVTIKQICNDAYLKYRDKITTKSIELSCKKFMFDDYSSGYCREKSKTIAIHECGHVLAGMYFKDNWNFYGASFNNKGGLTRIIDTNEEMDTVKKRKESIMIGLAGAMAEEVVYGFHDVGSFTDFEKAHLMAKRLIERVCIKGLGNLSTPYHCNDTRFETQIKIRNNEKKIIKLLKSSARKIKRIIKRNKDSLLLMAKIMYENDELSIDDVRNLKLV